MFGFGGKGKKGSAAGMNDESRPKLTDVLGALVSSVAHARRVADAEVMRIARLYQRHEYLQGMSIPRMRLSKVTINMPAIFDEMLKEGEAVPSKPDFIADNAIDRLARSRGDIAARLQDMEHEMPPDTFKLASELIAAVDEGLLNRFEEQLAAQLGKSMEGLEKLSSGTMPDVVIIEEVGKTTEEVFRKMISKFIAEKARAMHEEAREDEEKSKAARPWTLQEQEERVNEIMRTESVRTLISDVRTAAEQAAVQKGTRPADYFVIADTDAIKNVGTPDAVTRIQISITEDGLEWASEDGKYGATHWKLMPE